MSFRCPECDEGVVADRAVPGRKALVHFGLEIELPADSVLATCDRCLTYSLQEDQEPAFEEAAKAGQLAWQRQMFAPMLDAISRRHHISARKLPSVLGVNRASLDEISAGRELASVTLMRLLSMYLACRDEAEVHFSSHTVIGDTFKLAQPGTKRLWRVRIDGADVKVMLGSSSIDAMRGIVSRAMALDAPMVEMRLTAVDTSRVAVVSTVCLDNGNFVGRLSHPGSLDVYIFMTSEAPLYQRAEAIARDHAWYRGYVPISIEEHAEAVLEGIFPNESTA